MVAKRQVIHPSSHQPGPPLGGDIDTALGVKLAEKEIALRRKVKYLASCVDLVDAGYRRLTETIEPELRESLLKVLLDCLGVCPGRDRLSRSVGYGHKGKNKRKHIVKTENFLISSP